MNQRYNVVFRTHDEEWVARALTGLKQCIPQIEIIRTVGDHAVIDCPIWTEEIFVDYLEDSGCIVSKNRPCKITGDAVFDGEAK